MYKCRVTFYTQCTCGVIYHQVWLRWYSFHICTSPMDMQWWPLSVILSSIICIHVGSWVFYSDVHLCRLSTLFHYEINAWTAIDSSLGFENSLCQHLRSQAAWSPTLDGGSYKLLQRYYATSAGLHSTAKAPTLEYHAKARLQHLRSTPTHRLQQLRLLHLSTTPRLGYEAPGTPIAAE